MKYNIAVVGATGIVGRQILELLQERNFPVKTLSLFASQNSVGEFLEYADESVPVQLLEKTALEAVDIAFFCAGKDVSAQYCPIAAQAGVVCIDCSGFFCDDATVPLVVPEVNPDAACAVKSRRIIASPDCGAIQLSLLLQALRGASVIRRVVVTSCRAVSAAGQKGVDELRQHSGELLNGRPVKRRVFPQQVAFNCLPQVGEFLDDGCTSAEVDLVTQLRRILADDELAISATVVTVPVFYGECQSVNLETNSEVGVEQARALLDGFDGINLVDNVGAGSYPLPTDAAGDDAVYVGRLRADNSVANGLNLWSAMDNVRKGCATNAVQIAELVLEKYL